MINKLQLLRNVGQFDSVNSAANIALSRLTLVYAENGRGKTTLAAILRSLGTGDGVSIVERKRLAAANAPHVVLDCDGGPPAAMFQNGTWNRTIPDITVSDDVFVDQNVCSGLAVDSEHRQNLHELILGAQGVNLNRALQGHVARIERHNGALRTKADAIPANERGGLNIDDFCALPARADIDVAIQAAERNIAAVREQDPVRNTPLFDALALPEFDAQAIDALLQRDLPSLDAAAATQVQAHLARIGQGGEAWVGDGMRRVQPQPSGNTVGTCPFCAQSLGGSPVINHYRAYFSAGYADLKRAVTDAFTNIARLHGGDSPAAFERAVRVAGERRQFWTRFGDMPEVGLDTVAIGQDWRAARETVMAALQAKQAAPLDRVALPAEARAALTAFGVRRQEVTAVNQRLQQANGAIRVVKEQAAAGNANALAADLARLKAVKARHTPVIAPLCTDYLNEKAAKAATEQQRDQAKDALRQHRETVFPAYQTAINEYLRRFNAGFRLGNVAAADTRAGPTCNYSVVINNTSVPITGGATTPGEPSFRTTLSSGDRNTLALAFFFSSLDQDPALANKIVVIDDPMTSLDDHRALTTAQEVRTLSARAQQVIVLSHDKRFLCQVWENANRQTCTTLVLARDGSGSTIAAWAITEDSITDYDRQHSRLREYTRANTGNIRQVAQDLRHVLEGCLRRVCPEHFLPGEVLGELRRRIRNRQPNDREILSAAAVAELDSISEYANKFHHNTNPAWETEVINDAELKGWVDRTLAFVCK
jgi:wobble nucleotide-excising tRNase